MEGVYGGGSSPVDARIRRTLYRRGRIILEVARPLFALIFPDDCRVCEQRLTEISRVPVCKRCLAAPEALTAEYFCSHCRTPFLTPHPLDEEGRCGLCRRGWNGFDAAYTFGSYEGTLRELIHLYKYSGIRTLAEPLGDLMASVFPRDERFHLIVPMPLHWWRRWRRRFNQSRLLADILNRKTGTPVVEAARRLRSTPPQAGLSNSERRRNVTAAFGAKRTHALAGRRVLLVDDVLTTGATASACAAALKQAGAEHVSVLTLARTDRRTYTEPRPTALRAQAAEVGAKS